jgi:hypothetical protein
LIASGAENPSDIDFFNDSCIFELKAQLHLSIFTGQPMVKLALSVVPSNVLWYRCCRLPPDADERATRGGTRPPLQPVSNVCF